MQFSLPTTLASRCLPISLGALGALGVLGVWPSLSTAQASSLEAEMVEKLEALGYLGSGEDELGDTEQKTVQVAEFKIGGIRFEDPPPRVPFGKPMTNFRTDLEILRQVAEDDEIAGLKIEVKAGIECGLTLDGHQDVKEGDIIEFVAIEYVKRTLSQT